MAATTAVIATTAAAATAASAGGGVNPISSNKRIDVTLKLPQLQNLCKRDPVGYRSDYDAQIRRLRSRCSVLVLSPTSDGGGGVGKSNRGDLVELIQFAAAVSSGCYTKDGESDRIASLLVGLLTGRSSDDVGALSDVPTTDFLSNLTPGGVGGGGVDALPKDVRRAAVSSLILMRNKGALPPLVPLELFFRLMGTTSDKHLRDVLYRHVVNDVRNVNKKHGDERVNGVIKTFFHRVVIASSSSARRGSGGVDEGNELVARRCVDATAELYRRRVWTDARTVAIMASAVESSIVGVSTRAMRFFLNVEEKMAEDGTREDDVVWDAKRRVDLHLHSKKTQARKRHVEKQLKQRKKHQIKREQKLVDDEHELRGGVISNTNNNNLYPAIEMLNDPQGLAETMLKRLRQSASSYKFEVKLLMINFVTRLVGNHELILLPLYPFLQRYMGGGHQRDVTAVLAYTVQACHPYVPPEEVHGVLKTIAHNFVTERCSGEQMAVGINACRAICARVPSVLSTEGDGDDDAAAAGAGDTIGTGSVAMDVEAFAQDLAGYAKHRDRSAAVAGKAWTNFVRETHPSLLAGKDRGALGAALKRAGHRPLRYGEEKIASGVEGAELLAEYEAKKKKKAAMRVDPNSLSYGGDVLVGKGECGHASTQEKMNDVGASEDDEGWIDVDDSDGCESNDEGDEGEEGTGDRDIGETDKHETKKVADEYKCDDGSDDDDEHAPQLVEVTLASTDKDTGVISGLSARERGEVQQKISSTRIFTASEFEKMRKLVAREERDKRDPRAAARRKRAIARGEDFEELSGDDDDDGGQNSDGEQIKVHGAVNPGDIMAEARRKRLTKAEKLESIVAGREKFQHKSRDGGSTNTEKKRKKNFVMQKFSRDARKTKGIKDTARKANKRKKALTHEAKKRRRKF